MSSSSKHPTSTDQNAKNLQHLKKKQLNDSQLPQLENSPIIVTSPDNKTMNQSKQHRRPHQQHYHHYYPNQPHRASISGSSSRYYVQNAPRSNYPLPSSSPHQPYYPPQLVYSQPQQQQQQPYHPHHQSDQLISPSGAMPYDPIFLYPQSSVFANYLQLVHPMPNYPPPTMPSHYTTAPAPNHHPHSRHHSYSSPVTPNPSSPIGHPSRGVETLHHLIPAGGVPPTAAPPNSTSAVPGAGYFSVPRGPPKKPKKSGYALWVGNLPPNTTLFELCALFGTNEIQSIFLIQGTLCAFVNYKSEEALIQGKKMFEKRGKSLRGNQLIVEIKTDDITHKQGGNSSRDEIENYFDKLALNDDNRSSNSTSTSSSSSSSSSLALSNDSNKGSSKDRYFVCKSLTIEDLVASTTYGLWATQSHNESVFNEAFKTCDNVYLIFSANRAGEYYGYARMAGEIPRTASNKELLSLKNWNWNNDTSDPNKQHSNVPPAIPPQSQIYNPFFPATSPLPQVYPTAANKSIPIPAGRIVDDSCRGTLFWEVTETPSLTSSSKSRSSSSSSPSSSSRNTSRSSSSSSSSASNLSSKHRKSSEDYTALEEEDLGNTNNWTVPFKIQWMSPPGKTVPFYMVRHLKNPYNKNQPVKIARDGTEIEPSVGKQIIEMFFK